MRDVVVRGAGNAARNTAVLTMILQRVNVYPQPRTITTRSAVKKRRVSRILTIAPVDTARIVVADGKLSELRPAGPPNLL